MSDSVREISLGLHGIVAVPMVMNDWDKVKFLHFLVSTQFDKTVRVRECLGLLSKLPFVKVLLANDPKHWHFIHADIMSALVFFSVHKFVGLSKKKCMIFRN